MILIADSGSTKCDWALCNEAGEIITQTKTIGLNPYFIESKKIQEVIEDSELTLHKEKIKNVIFYGAGCSSKEKNKILEDELLKCFKNSEIKIRHDIKGACYASYNGVPNITCILGTGSNSCFFDGEKITSHAPSLGFLIDDIGSGNYFGKKIINLYFNNRFPKDLSRKLEEKYETDWTIVKENIYNNDRPNVYLAEYFPFIIENRNHPLIKNLINNSLDKFVQTHIMSYKNYKNLVINFVGSVSFFLSDEIKEIIKLHNCKMGGIIKNPIKNLVNFHFNYKKQPFRKI